MRIAFTGAHRTGKTTLRDALAGVLDHETIDEPYHALTEEGHEFADPPTVEDYEAQLRRSLADFDAADRHALIDRCPLDFLAYLRAVDDSYDIMPWMDDVDDALSRLDVLVFVPIESHVTVAHGEDLQMRADVDTILHALVEDAMPAEVTLVEVTGTIPERVQQVLAALSARDE